VRKITGTRLTRLFVAFQNEHWVTTRVGVSSYVPVQTTSQDHAFGEGFTGGHCLRRVDEIFVTGEFSGQRVVLFVTVKKNTMDDVFPRIQLEKMNLRFD
jgi:hypothetical protein